MNRKTRNAEPDIGTDCSRQARQNLLVDKSKEGLAHQEAAGQGFWPVYDRPEPFLVSKPGLLACSLDLSPTEVWPPDMPSACWPQYMMEKSDLLFDFIVDYTHMASALLSKIGVTLQACRPRSSSDSSWQTERSRIFRLGSGTQVIAEVSIDTMVVSTIYVTIRMIDSSSPGQCHENRWVLSSPTLFPALSGST